MRRRGAGAGACGAVVVALLDEATATLSGFGRVEELVPPHPLSASASTAQAGTSLDAPKRSALIGIPLVFLADPQPCRSRITARWDRRMRPQIPSQRCLHSAEPTLSEQRASVRDRG